MTSTAIFPNVGVDPHAAVGILWRQISMPGAFNPSDTTFP